MGNLFQFTEEKLGKAERTENDPHFESLAGKTDNVKQYTERMVKNVEAVLVPNPAARYGWGSYWGAKSWTKKQ